MNDADTVHDITEDSFQYEVIEASRSVPVLVDFWADWCQPCRMLAPLLEQLAQAHAGAVKIVKVDSDAQPQLAAGLGVRALPTVKLFRHGKLVDEFSGVQPLSALQAFLAPHLPRETDALLREAEILAGAGRRKEALDLLYRALEADSEDYRIPPRLADLLMAEGRLDEAERLLKSLPANVQQDEEVLRLNARLAFARTAGEAADAAALSATLEKEPDNLDARYQYSAVKIMQGEYEEAMDSLLEIISRDRSYRDDIGRRALVDVFQLLGNEGPLVKKYRGKLSSVLN
ncbi:MAG: thioredoxin [Gammaproteobacteria bacterium]|jgi:putative thioredoxin